VAVSLAVVAALAFGAATFAAGPANPGTSATNTANCGMGYGRNGWLGEASITAVSQLLGMTADEIQALRLEGKSLVEIAGTRNVTQEQLVAAIVAAKTAEIQNRVAAGTLTQQQANIMLQNMEQNTIQAVNRVSVGPFGNGGNGVCDQLRTQLRTQLQTRNSVCQGQGAGTAAQMGRMFGRNR